MTSYTPGPSSLPGNLCLVPVATPEPRSGGLADHQPQPPSRPPRIRLRKRVASSTSLNAPTSHFLASVATADIPIPTIEEPNPAASDAEVPDGNNNNNTYPVIHQLKDVEHHASNVMDADGIARDRAFSPPRTPEPRARARVRTPAPVPGARARTPAPTPGAVPLLSPRGYPDWSVGSSTFSSPESSPEPELSRPSTSRSTMTSASDFSHLSHMIDDDEDDGLVFDGVEPFPSLAATTKPGHSFGSPPTTGLASPPPSMSLEQQPGRVASKKYIPWTSAMSRHLWDTYNLYLQDPKVTPFRAPSTGVPPDGVCIRVAREAVRSWRGSRAQAQTRAGTGTASSAGTYLEWPHKLSATRHHLRELCRIKSGSSRLRCSQDMAHCPTPLGPHDYARAAHRFRRTAAAAAAAARSSSSSVFGATDMAVSLALSTSESMQPTGFLARLTLAPSKSPVSPVGSPTIREEEEAASAFGDPVVPATIARPFLDSPPFFAQNDVAMAFPEDESKNIPVSPARRGLQSPVRMAHARSRSTTHKINHQKLRSRAATNEPRRCRRPSVSELWSDSAPSQALRLELASIAKDDLDASARTRAVAGADADATVFRNRPGGDEEYFFSSSFLPYTPRRMEGLFRPRAQTTSVSPHQYATPQFPDLSPRPLAPARLGSPFPSFSFPNRFTNPTDGSEHGAANVDARRPYSTMQTLGDAFPGRDLTGRRSRIRELIQGHRRRRSDSPY